MAGSYNHLLRSERLRGSENYRAWRSRVYNILEGNGLEDYLESTCVKPEPLNGSPAAEGATPSSNSSLPSQDPTATDETTARAARQAEIKAWKANNGRAKTIIQANCTQEPNGLLVDISTASEMWSILQALYEGKGKSLKA